MNFKEYHPPHIYLDQTIYFITSRTIDKENFWDIQDKKQLFLSCLKAGLQKYKISLYAWVLLENHYHLLLKIKSGNDLPKFINFLNGRSSFELNKSENKTGRKIWYQYWDRIIRDKKDFYSHLNYIHNNLIKHGLIKNFKELKLNNNSSYKKYIEKYGEEWLMECFSKYPVIDYSDDE